MAKPGYGKRSAPDQRPRTRDDFALLPTRERYVAGFVDHLPEGAAMSVKHLAKQLPLYGQQAISTALNALSVAGHLRRVRCAVGAGDETRWVFRTFWSRTAHGNEWWNTYLATENATTQATSPVLDAPAPDTTPPPPPWVPAEEPPPTPVPPKNPRTGQSPAAPQEPEQTAVPHQRIPAPQPYDAPTPPAPAETPTEPSPSKATPAKTAPAKASPSEAAPSPAYLALAHLGRNDHRLALSAHDCTTLEPQATEWLTRGVSTDYLTSALTQGLPTTIDSPVAFLRHRLTDKFPPTLPTTPGTPPNTPTPPQPLRIECTNCGRPGPPQALPDGLCRPCR
ncbi:MarR family transcriptional regulator, partial [Streptomyces sp. NPDC007346]|uniref:MarR family transcriptional regulator n=1 Tax=Streptomyces sp. NPDC007346 TaxID=3154682 RepID=UPI003453B5F8